jgi:hypothetical protein
MANRIKTADERHDEEQLRTMAPIFNEAFSHLQNDASEYQLMTGERLDLPETPDDFFFESLREQLEVLPILRDDEEHELRYEEEPETNNGDTESPLTSDIYHRHLHDPIDRRIHLEYPEQLTENAIRYLGEPPELQHSKIMDRLRKHEYYDEIGNLNDVDIIENRIDHDIMDEIVSLADSRGSISKDERVFLQNIANTSPMVTYKILRYFNLDVDISEIKKNQDILNDYIDQRTLLRSVKNASQLEYETEDLDEYNDLVTTYLVSNKKTLSPIKSNTIQKDSESSENKEMGMEDTRLLEIKMKNVLTQLLKSKEDALSESRHMGLEDLRTIELRRRHLDNIREYIENVQMGSEESRQELINDIDTALKLINDTENTVERRITVNKIKDIQDRPDEQGGPHIPRQIGGPKQPGVPPQPEIPKMPVYNKIADGVEMHEFKQVLHNLYEYAILTDPYPDDTEFNKSVRAVNRIREMYNINNPNSRNLTKKDRDVLGNLLKIRMKQYYTNTGDDVRNINKLRDLSNANKVMGLPKYTKRITNTRKHIKFISPNFPKNTGEDEG